MILICFMPNDLNVGLWTNALEAAITWLRSHPGAVLDLKP